MKKIRFVLIGLVLFSFPTSVHAHLVSTGFGPFYDGLSHLFIAVEDLLTVLAFGLLAGLGGAGSGKGVLFTLTGAWILGGLAGLGQTSEFEFQLAAIVSFLLVGALVALDRTLAVGLVIGLAAVFGALHGFLNGTAMVAAKLGAIGMIGVGSAVFVLTAFVAAFVVSLRLEWARIAVRVAGSWIAAVGLLMVGWTARGT